jgi:hypothetical protein
MIQIVRPYGLISSTVAGNRCVPAERIGRSCTSKSYSQIAGPFPRPRAFIIVHFGHKDEALLV